MNAEKLGCDKHRSFSRADSGVHSVDGILNQSDRINFNGRVDDASDPGEFEQVCEQGVHFIGCACDALEVALDLVGAVVLQIPDEHAEKTFDRDERVTQIVRDCVGEAGQLVVAVFKFSNQFFAFEKFVLQGVV